MLQRINWLSISFLFPHRQNNSCPFTRTLTLYKDVTFFTDVTITFLFREVPVKLLLRLLQVFFLHIHLRQNTQGPMFSTIFQ